MLCTNSHVQILHKNGQEGDMGQSSSYTMSCHFLKPMYRKELQAPHMSL